MKTFLFILIVAIVIVYASANSAFNDLKTAVTYKDIANHNPINAIKYSADPSVMVYNKRVYIYATNDGSVDQLSNESKSNGYNQIKSVNVMSSDDLVNWIDHGAIPVAGKDGAATWANNSWAPQAAYKNINGKDKFFLYFANSGNGIGVLTSDSPTGPFVDPLGKALVTRSTPNCSDIVWLFDPAVLVDDDGTGYLYFGGGVPDGEADNPKTLRVVKLGDDMISLDGTPVTIEAPWSYEDSGINKIGDTYYFSYCTNWESGPYGDARIAYMTSKSPLGPFTFQGTIFNNPGEFFKTPGNNHHAIIEFKDQFYIFYHTEWLNKQEFGEMKGYRASHVDVLPFSDGKFGNAKGTLTGISQLFNINAFKSNYASMTAWQAGVTINGLGHTTVTYNRGDWTGVSNINFSGNGNGASSVKISAASANGAVIRITTGSENGDVVGYVTIPATGDNNSFKTITAQINKVSGVKNVFFTASDDVTIDTWQFIPPGLEEPTTEPEQPEPEEPTQNVEPVPEEPVEEPVEEQEEEEVTEEIIIQDTGSVRLPDGWYYIRNPSTKRYLQVKGSVAAPSTSVVIGTGRRDNAQKWKLTNVNGYVTLTSALGDYMLDVESGSNEDNTNIQIYHAYGGDAQQFILYKTSVENAFVIATKISNGNKAIDIEHKYNKENTNVLLWKNEAKSNQIWVFENLNGEVQKAETRVISKPKPETKKEPEQAACWSTALGFPCCTKCSSVYFTDDDGEWGVENDDWCGLLPSCSD